MENVTRNMYDICTSTSLHNRPKLVDTKWPHIFLTFLLISYNFIKFKHKV